MVSRYLAEYFGIDYVSEETVSGSKDRDFYYVPPVTQVLKNTHLPLKDEHDFYGTLVGDVRHVHKTILHPTLSKSVPDFYSHQFAKYVLDLTVPGVSVFDKEDIKEAYESLKVRFGKKIRLKVPDESDGRNQLLIDDNNIEHFISGVDEKRLKDNGLVLGVNLNDTDTVSVGFCSLQGEKYSFLALQKNDVAPEDGRDRYLGALVRVVKGDIDNLTYVAVNEREKEAVEVCSRFYSGYSYFEPVVSRISFDCLFGLTEKGEEYRGITDITGRLGGTCPALIMSVMELKNEKEALCIESEVSLNYKPEKELENELNAVRFIDLPSLRLTARINGKRCI